jgi:hypothetical protein
LPEGTADQITYSLNILKNCGAMRCSPGTRTKDAQRGTPRGITESLRDEPTMLEVKTVRRDAVAPAARN